MFILVFGLIGLVRGFLRELGVTTVLLLVLFAFDRWGEKTSDYVLQGLRVVGMTFAGAAEESIAKVSFYLVTIAIAAFISYHGETLAFQGTLPKGGISVVLAFLIGMVNGYLVMGTVWFYLNKFDYPLQLVSEPLTSLALGLIEILPLAVLSPFLPFLMVFMVIVRVMR